MRTVTKTTTRKYRTIRHKIRQAKKKFMKGKYQRKHVIFNVPKKKSRKQHRKSEEKLFSLFLKMRAVIMY